MQSMQSNLRRRLSIKARSFAASTPGTTDGFPELYVCNLPREATEKSVREAFSKVVDIKSLRVPFSRTTGRCAGYAFLAVDAADAERVRKEMHGFIFGSHSIEVEMAKTSRDVASVAVFQAEKERVRAQRNFDKLLAKAEDEVEVVKLPELFVRNLPVDFSAADVKLAFKDACEVRWERGGVGKQRTTLDWTRLPSPYGPLTDPGPCTPESFYGT
ncbi:hypothetical protein M885DRAFT_497195 [Pelagophyceae sp. CCMP2097]|nr:hypothetical protein M885DRAFT_497195 [Pelagophyceae sp. CCMP2097]